MNIEKNYDFCKRLLEVHKKDRRNFSLTKNDDEFEFVSPVKIIIEKDADVITKTAAFDFADYLFTSMNVSAFVQSGGEVTDGCIKITTNKDLGTSSERRGHRISVSDYVLIEGFDGPGNAQGLYYLEDVMNLRQAPFLKKGTENRRIMFVPRTVLSGYGMDEYPDEYLNLLAHHGFSGINLWIKDVNESKKGYLNFTDISTRAAKYGFDIYVMSHAKHDVYPEGEEAQKYYDKIYAEMFEKFPFIKGLTVLAEAIDFASRDTRIPKGVRKGFFPCNDWPLLLKMIRKAVDKVKPGVEIILSSYNWGYQPAELRDELTAILPKDTILQCGWEMFEYYDLDGVKERCEDYSLRVAEPGYYFRTEAESCAKHGIRLQTISNTGGKTWDFGAIPFVPAPYRWKVRHEALRYAYCNNNLRGLCDSIHYGVYPSFITEIAKWAFAKPMVDLDEMIPKILAMHFGHEEIDKIDLAMRKWSEAVANNVPTNEDQYGALRIGPSYPFYSGMEGVGDGEAPPQDKFAAHKLRPGMYHNVYKYCSQGDAGDVRIPKEIATFEKEKQLLSEGIELLESVENKNEELVRLIGMGKFMYRTVITVLNRKHYFVLDNKLQAETDEEKKKEIITSMLGILENEKQNAIDTIPLVEADSILGFEPSMEYVTDRKRLEWKIAQVEKEAEMLRKKIQ